LKCDGTRAETRFRLSAKRPSPFKSAGASVQLTTCRRDVRISGSNAGYTMFRGSVKCTGYPLHLPVSPSLPLPCVAVCHHVSTGLYLGRCDERNAEDVKKKAVYVLVDTRRHIRECCSQHGTRGSSSFVGDVSSRLSTASLFFIPL